MNKPNLPKDEIEYDIKLEMFIFYLIASIVSFSLGAVIGTIILIINN